jgi:hypothetical protein
LEGCLAKLRKLVTIIGFVVAVEDFDLLFVGINVAEVNVDVFVTDLLYIGV